MREINKVIVHCSYTPTEMDIGVEEIRRWHVGDNGWSDIGYHWVIRRDGTIEEGRPENIAGAHTRGHNRDSIGVCLIGGKTFRSDRPEMNFTLAQFNSLRDMVDNVYSELLWFGHREFNKYKECPCFEVPLFVHSNIIQE